VQKIRSGNVNATERDRLDAAIVVLARSELTVDDDPSLTMQELITRWTTAVIERGVSLIVLDGGDLVDIGDRAGSGPDVSFYHRLGNLSSQWGIPIVVTASLPRSNTNVATPGSTCESPNSTASLYDASVVIELARVNSTRDLDEEVLSVDLKVMKNDYGPPHSISGILNMSTLSFRDRRGARRRNAPSRERA
jgi:replicative DNA helicase